VANNRWVGGITANDQATTNDKFQLFTICVPATSYTES
jgi:hypothetical protein